MNALCMNIGATYIIITFYIIYFSFIIIDIVSSPTCDNDYVEVFDGPSMMYPSLGKFCGNQLPGKIRSNGTSMLVNFVSDQVNASTGFLATYVYGMIKIQADNYSSCV